LTDWFLLCMMPSMGRPREFDIDEATDQAMLAFWRGGYGGTSLSDLMAATGLEKGSLYKAFGSKENLFLAALDRYLAAGVTQIESTVRNAPSAVEALRAVLDGLAESCSGARGAAGCLAVNATIEAEEGPDSAARRLANHWAWNRSLFERIVVQGQAENSFRDDLSAVDLADILTRLVIGTAVVCRRDPAAGSDLSERVLALLTPARVQ
jgi:TetR/AcrR family transcriptional repressor of nem operon